LLEASEESQATYPVQYPNSLNLKLLTFAFLTGSDLFNKIAVTSKKIRNSMKGAGLLDQVKVITVKAPAEN
jgi:hypothetical protein